MKKSSILRLQVLKLLRTILSKVLKNSKKNTIAEETKKLSCQNKVLDCQNARFLSKVPPTFFFICAKKVGLHRRLLPYLPKITQLIIVAMPRHEQGMLRHVLKSLFLLRHGMLRHASLGLLYCSCYGMDQSCRGMLLNFAQNCFFLLLYAFLCPFFDHFTRISPTT